MKDLKTYTYLCVISVLFSVAECRRGFMLTSPRILDTGSLVYLTVALTGVPNGGYLSVSLLNPHSDETFANAVVFAHNNQNTWVPLGIPNVDVSTATLWVTGSFADGYEINEKRIINLRHQSIAIFIQTDKPIYKPGQTVQFRILTLDSQLVPLKGEVIGDIWIEDPHEIRIAQWKQLNFSDGLVQLSLPLSEEPTKGIWRIKANVTNKSYSQTFEVDECVLPKFEVIIHPPPYVMADAEDILVKICAKYTYGENVDGFLNAQMTYVRPRYDGKKKSFPLVEYEGQISGCTDFLVQANQILLNHPRFGFKTLQVVAKVVEKGTGILQNASKTIEITHMPLKMIFLGVEKGSYYYKPGLPYNGKVQILKPDGKVAASETIIVCAVIKIQKQGQVRRIQNRLCNTFSSDKDGIVKFVIPAQTSKTIEIELEITSTIPKVLYDTNAVKIKQPSLFLTLIPWYSPSGSYLQIEPLSNDVQCNRSEKVKIKYTTGNWSSIKFHHQVISRGRIVQLGSHSRSFYAGNKANLATNTADDEYMLKFEGSTSAVPDTNLTSLNHVSQFTFAFDARSSMSPVARLLVFYLRDDGEIVADSKTFKIAHCLRNQVKFLFRHSQQYPGTDAAMLLSATPNSLCGITMVDKSIQLLRPEQKFSKAKVFQLMETYDVGRNTSHVFKRCPIEVFDDSTDTDLKRRKRSVMIPVSEGYHDSMTAFVEAGTIVITDLLLETAPCVKFRSIQVHTFSDLRTYDVPVPEILTLHDVEKKVEDSNQDRNKEPSEVRSYFPETWLWELHKVGESGEMALKRQLPHTITEWVGEAVCVHPGQGLGISDSTGIVAFQPFFASFNLPYSVIRGETVTVVLSVFNYLTDCLQIGLSLEQSEFFDVVNSSYHQLCVCGEKSVTSQFYISPLIVGTVNITVYAHTISDEKVCENEIASRLNARDAVTRSLLVEPEGFPKEEIYNYYVCPQSTNGTFSREIDLLLPENVVQDSARAYLSVTGDLMGPALDSLENLVRLPKGCGEQNMVKFTPIVYILDYLTKTDQITDEIKHKCIGFLQKGYQRELKYRHSDGSYSAFGSSDREGGNTWLTAFVIRSFAQAAQFITIDQEDLNLSVIWLTQKQLENGCFMPSGYLLNKALQGGLQGSQSLAPLTAYVLISLLEADIKSITIISNAIYCLQTEENPSMYSLSLFAYASALAGNRYLAQSYLQELEKQAIKNKHLMHWEYEGGSNKAVDVEIAGYYILALLQLNQNNSFIEALPVVRWIASQRNSKGGFVSTQDTVVALQALAKYSSYANFEKLDMEIIAESGDFKRIFNVNDNNKLLMQTVKIPELPNIVDLQVTGKGCSLIQISSRYNVDNTTISDAFDVRIEASREGSLDCNIPTIGICMRYKIPREVSNMVVLEVKMVSGYVVDVRNLDKLKQETAVQLKRFEVIGNSVNFYFQQLSNEQKCFRFSVKNEIEVANEREARVKIYDYYQPELEMTTSYSIPAFCSLSPLPDFPRLLPMIFKDDVISTTQSTLHVSKSNEMTTELPITTKQSTTVPLMTTTGPLMTTTVPLITTTVPSMTTTVPLMTTTVPLMTTTGLLMTTTVPLITTTVPLITTTAPPITTTSPPEALDAALDDADMQNDASFVKVDEDLNFPDGMEENKPVYVLPPKKFLDQKSVPVSNCPICLSAFPADFSNLYCSTELALRVFIKNAEKKNAKLLQDVSACLPKSKAMKLHARLVYDTTCDCNLLKQKGLVYVLTQKEQLQKAGKRLLLNLHSHTYIVAGSFGKEQINEMKMLRKNCKRLHGSVC